MGIGESNDPGGKREISVGFSQPSRLERDTIYLWSKVGMEIKKGLGKYEDGIDFKIISKEPFVAGNLHSIEDEVGNYRMEVFNPGSFDKMDHRQYKIYKTFLEKLMEGNDGYVDEQRLWHEGISAHS